ncbi:unnamed protein product [Clonostachys solani]|uniref:Uncharacterized protein n=1 Tax=Clonostachys solani TaxID=160281 RepID=A0A9N9ZGZ2_9HYPO|nr:unnamed protein product [Clonostachys solani]
MNIYRTTIPISTRTSSLLISLYPQQGRNISAKLASNKNAVTYFEKIATKDAIIAIFKHLEGQEAIHTKYRFSELRFTSAGSQPANEGDPSEDRLERRLQTGPNKRVASEQRVKPRPTNPDRFGLRTQLSGDKSMAFVYDYKAAHKVVAEHVKLAVVKEILFMEVIKQLNSNKSRIGAELEQFRAEARIAIALTQVFDYMVNYRVTLYCHPCMLDEDVGETSAANWADKIIYTAVAQLSSLVLLSLRSNTLQGAILDASLESVNAALARWPELYEDAAHFLSEEDIELSLDDFTSSAAPTSRVVSLRTRSLYGISALRRRDHDSDEEEEPEGRLPSTQTTSDMAKRKVGPSDSSSEEDAEMPSSAPTRQYCSQACLLGLKKGQDLDNGCPNMLSYRIVSEASTQYLINANEFTRLVSLQLYKDPYRNCYALDRWGKKGAIGILFRLELKLYSYTFIGKGI